MLEKKTYKNYKSLCETMGWKPTGGDTKIKHSKEVVPQQCKHLLDEQKCKDTEFRYGTIIGKYVIYRGATTSLVQAGVETQEDVTYLNVEEYLKKL